MLRPAILAAALALTLPAVAHSAVTATSEPTSVGVLITVVGDAADDPIVVSCGSDGRVKVNDLDVVEAADCADVTSISVDGGPGQDFIDLAAVSPTTGFSSRTFCGPCPGGDYSLVAECVSGVGDDTILAGGIGTLIGGCSGRQSMPGDDVVRGSDQDDAIAAGPGSDEIRSRNGADQVFGGPGNDRIEAGSGDDVLAGKQGKDILYARSGDDRLAGGPGRDGLFGGHGFDACVGGPDGADANGCEAIRGVSRAVSLGFAPRFE
jgi:Ca2+-binding RTX toxin-like protein